MPVDLKDIASIAGMSGLFRIVSPSRNGIVVEALDEKANRFVAQAKHRISLLSEISVYQENSEETLPLSEVFNRIRQQYGTEIPVDGKSSNTELASFMAAVVPTYDRERVYMSDIKKLATWYKIVSKHLEFTEAETAVTTEPSPEENISDTDEVSKS